MTAFCSAVSQREHIIGEFPCRSTLYFQQRRSSLQLTGCKRLDAGIIACIANDHQGRTR